MSRFNINPDNSLRNPLPDSSIVSNGLHSLHVDSVSHISKQNTACPNHKITNFLSMTSIPGNFFFKKLNNPVQIKH